MRDQSGEDHPGARASSGPDWRAEVRARLATLDDRQRVDDIVEELSQHLDDRYRELIDTGAPESAARRMVVDELAAQHVLGRAVRRAVPPPSMPPRVLGQPARSGWFTGIWTDVRDGVRALRGSPGLTIVALITLAIGIGANAAIFSVVNAAILRPLPFAEPDRLVQFWGSNPAMGLPIVNYPDALLVYVRTHARAIGPVAAFSFGGVTLTGNRDAERVDAALVTADFFRLLGRSPREGRAFLPDEETRGRGDVAILSDGLWRRRYGATPGMVGKTITIDQRPVTVVGIMPEGFDFPYRTQLWMPKTIDPTSLGCWCYTAIGRLAPGKQPEEAMRELSWLNDNFWLEREGKPPEHLDSSHGGKSVIVAQPLARVLAGDMRTPLLVLLGAVGIVLLIACANIANLLLARANARGREIAVRCCLGASPWRIARQLLVESLLVALSGAAIGLALAAWGARALGALAVEYLSYVHVVSLDVTVLFFTLVVTLATVVLFGVAPALRGARVDLQDAVKDGWRTTRAASSRRLSDAFVVAQFALSIVLLVGAGLLLRSLGNLLAVDPGFRPENVLVGRISLPWIEGPEEPNLQRARLFYRQLATRVHSLPGVTRVGLTSIAPFSNGGNGQLFVIRGREPRKGEPTLVAEIRGVTPGYFDAIGTPLRRGRIFDDRDTEKSPLVVVVDETLARRFWPDGNAIGHELRLGDDGPWRTIVGVVASVKHGDVAADFDRYIYVPHPQRAHVEMDLVVRAAADPATLTATIRREIQSMDSSLPFYQVHTLEAAVARSVGTRRLTNNLLLAFAVAALVLAAVGIYGVMSLAVGQRVHEFGIRLALGASPAAVLSLVLRQGMRLVAIGAAFGLAAAVGVTRYLGALLFNVTPLDPVVFASVTAILVAVALAACFIPARRATATDPLVVMRS